MRGVNYMLGKKAVANLVTLFTLVSSVALAREAGEQIAVERNESDGTLTVLVRSHNGFLDSNDILRGLARAAKLDEDAAVEGVNGRQLDLRNHLTWLSVRALSAAMPDVKLRIVDDPTTCDATLRIRFEIDPAQEKIRNLKSLVQEKFSRDNNSSGLQYDPSWKNRPADRPLVVLVPGYNAGAQSVADFQDVLNRDGWPCARFGYPNDGPLDAAARKLAAALHDFATQNPGRPVVLVAHSMGGLVAREAIENPQLDPGNIKSLIMICTPNYGSRWAELPAGLDLWEHMRSLPDHSLRETFHNSIADGLNEAREDLQPNSKFLRKLNARPRNANVRYTLILGTQAPYSADQIATVRTRTDQTLARSQPGRIVAPRVDACLSDFGELECGKGDWFVSVERGRLEGVPDTILLPITHWTFTAGNQTSARQQLFDLVRERLVFP